MYAEQFEGTALTHVSQAAVCHGGGCGSFLVTGISCEVRPWGVNTEYYLLKELKSHTLHLVCKWISWQIIRGLRVKRGWKLLNPCSFEI